MNCFRNFNYTNDVSKIFLNGCGNIIASNIEKDLIELALELETCIRPIVEDARRSSTSRRLLDSFSDLYFCHMIVVHCQNTLHRLFLAITDLNRRTPDINNPPLGFELVKQLISRMLIVENSILYREIDLTRTIIRIVFEDPEFVASGYHPLRINHHEIIQNINDNQLRQYFRILIQVLGRLLRTGESNFFREYFLVLHSDISKIIENNNGRLEVNDPRNFFSIPGRILNECCTGIILLIKTINNQARNLPIENDTNFDQDNYNFFVDKTIYGALANGIFRAIEIFSNNSFNSEIVRQILLSTYGSIPETHVMISIRRRFNILLENKIRENIMDRFGPAIIPNLIYTFDLPREDSRFPFQRLLFQMLTNNFVILEEQSPQFALDLLPNDTVYVRETGQLIRTVNRGRGRMERQVLQLNNNL